MSTAMLHKTILDTIPQI